MRIPCSPIFLCLVTLWTACSDKDRIPSDVIPREEMEKILWDMVQADQFSATYIAKDSLIDWKDSLRNFRKDSVRLAALRMPAAKGPGGLATKDPTGPGTKNPSAKDAAPPHAVAPRLTAKDSAWQKTEDSLRISQMKDVFRASLKIKTLQLYQQVFQLHHITLEEFRRSYQYYVERPDITKTLVDSVLSRGNRLRTESYGHPSGDTAKKTPVVTSPAPGQAAHAPGQAAPGQATLPIQRAGANSRLPSNFFLKTKQAAGAARHGKDSSARLFPQP